MQRKFVLSAIGGALIAAAAIGAVPVIADSDPPATTPHRHYINGVEVGPDVCDNPNLMKAFTQFHYNVHRHHPDTQGPDTAAPGLHNGKGGEIVFAPCEEQ